jgi:hypothetical protein
MGLAWGTLAALLILMPRRRRAQGRRDRP